MNSAQFPIAVIGGGPIGLAAAAHLAERGEAFVLLEAGASVAANVRGWGHVRVFTPWRYLVDKAAGKLLTRRGWSAPDDEAYPTGHDLIDSYLQPLSEVPEIAPFVKVGARVISVARQNFDKMKTTGREKTPFLITYQTPDGCEEQLVARAVIDASGGKVNPLGASGVPALGERTNTEHIWYGIPDILGAQRDRYVGKRVLVAGSGHSAFNAVIDLIGLASAAPDTQITWAVRREAEGQMFGGGAGDELAARGKLGERAQSAVASGQVQFLTGVRIQRLERLEDGIAVYDARGKIGTFDEIISATGFRPELSILSELRLSIHDATEGVAAIAPLIDPNFHSCGSVPPHGAEELRHPEADFYMVGMKSYGRAPTFLMLTGYEQVRSVVAALAGDWEAARNVELVLPETGVCSGGPESGRCVPETSNQNAAQTIIPLEMILTPVSVQAEASCCGSDCCGGVAQRSDQGLISMNIPITTRPTA